MRDVGGKSFDAIHARPQRLGHVAQRAGEIADLIAATGEIGNSRMPAVATAHPLRGIGETADRAGDGAGKIDRQQHRDGKSDGEDLEDIEADLADGLGDLRPAAGQHERAQYLSIALDRHGDGQQQSAI